MGNTIIRVPVGAVTIAADLTSPVGASPVRGTVVGVRYTATTLITGTVLPNSRHLTLFNRGQAGAGVAVAGGPLALGVGTDCAANVARPVPVGATPAVAVGDVLDWDSTHDGTGLVDSGGVVEIEIAPALA